MSSRVGLARNSENKPSQFDDRVKSDLSSVTMESCPCKFPSGYFQIKVKSATRPEGYFTKPRQWIKPVSSYPG